MIMNEILAALLGSIIGSIIAYYGQYRINEQNQDIKEHEMRVDRLIEFYDKLVGYAFLMRKDYKKNIKYFPNEVAEFNKQLTLIKTYFNENTDVEIFEAYRNLETNEFEPDDYIKMVNTICRKINSLAKNPSDKRVELNNTVISALGFGSDGTTEKN